MRKMNIFGKKGQNTAEYAIVIALVIAAALAMQTYVKRGMQGRMHDASNKFYDKVAGDANWSSISTTTANALTSKQYEPEKLESKATQETLEDYEKSEMAKGGTVTRESRQRTKEAAGDYQKYGY